MIDIEIPKKEGSSSGPNWKKNGFSSAQNAMLYAIALTVKNVPSAEVSWGDRTWTKDDFSKEVLKSVIDLI